MNSAVLSRPAPGVSLAMHGGMKALAFVLLALVSTGCGSAPDAQPGPAANAAQESVALPSKSNNLFQHWVGVNNGDWDIHLEQAMEGITSQVAWKGGNVAGPCPSGYSTWPVTIVTNSANPLFEVGGCNASQYFFTYEFDGDFLKLCGGVGSCALLKLAGRP